MWHYSKQTNLLCNTPSRSRPTARLLFYLVDYVSNAMQPSSLVAVFSTRVRHYCSRAIQDCLTTQWCLHQELNPGPCADEAHSVKKKTIIVKSKIIDGKYYEINEIFIRIIENVSVRKLELCFRIYRVNFKLFVQTNKFTHCHIKFKNLIIVSVILRVQGQIREYFLK